MAATDFIVAVELGSTEITGMVGRKNADGSLNVLACVSEKSANCIRKGVIYNLDKTTQKITSVIKGLEDKLQTGIRKVYIGVGGLSLRSVRNTESRQLGNDTRISQTITDSMARENLEKAPLDYEILAVEPQEYRIGNNLLTEPVGTTADSIEGNYLNVIARPSVKQNIRQCLSHTGYDIAEFIVSPVATADAVLTADEKRSGCALVDIGAGTTTVSVYKNNILRHVCVIPLGGNNITRDIADRQIEEDDAELIKLKFASAYTEHKEDEEARDQELTVDGKFTIQSGMLEDIVEARVNEILSNVFNQIKLSGYSDSLMAGIIVTGGTANLPDMDKAVTNVTKMEKVRIALACGMNLTGNTSVPEDGRSNTIIGILMRGDENCCRIDPRKGPQLDFDGETASGSGKVGGTEVKNAPVEDSAKECQRLVCDASQLILMRDYLKALEILEKAERLNVEGKAVEIETLIKEARRLHKEAERVKEIKEAKLRTERQKKEECGRLLDEADELIKKGDRRTAKEKLTSAREYNIAEYDARIKELEEKTANDRKDRERSLIDKIKKISEEFWGEIK